MSVPIIILSSDRPEMAHFLRDLQEVLEKEATVEREKYAVLKSLEDATLKIEAGHPQMLVVGVSPEEELLAERMKPVNPQLTTVRLGDYIMVQPKPSFDVHVSWADPTRNYQGRDSLIERIHQFLKGKKIS